MPFVSENQRGLCYALKAKGQAGSWDCDEWSHETPKNKKLPKKVTNQKKQAQDPFESFLNGLSLSSADMNEINKINFSDLGGMMGGGKTKPAVPSRPPTARSSSFSPGSLLSILAAQFFQPGGFAYNKIQSFLSPRGTNMQQRQRTLVNTALDIMNGQQKKASDYDAASCPASDIHGEAREAATQQMHRKVADAASMMLVNLAKELPGDKRADLYLTAAALSAGKNLEASIKLAFGEDISPERLEHTKQVILDLTSQSIKLADELQYRAAQEKKVASDRAQICRTLHGLMKTNPVLVKKAYDKWRENKAKATKVNG